MSERRAAAAWAMLLAACAGPAWTDPLPSGERRPIEEWVAAWRPDVFESACAGRDGANLTLELGQVPVDDGVVLEAVLGASCARRAHWALRLGSGQSCRAGCDLALVPAVSPSAIGAWGALESERARFGGRSRTGTVLIPSFDGAALSTAEFDVLAASSAVRRGELFTVRAGDRVSLAAGLRVEVVGSGASPRGALALRVHAGAVRALLVFDLNAEDLRALVRQVCASSSTCPALEAEIVGVTLPAEGADSPLSEGLLRAARPDAVILASGPEPGWRTLTRRVERARRIARAQGAELVSLHETRVVARPSEGHWALELDPAAAR